MAELVADDISMWTLAKSTMVAKVRLQKSLNDLELWCSIWRIKLNVAKTQLVRFIKRRLVRMVPIPERLRSLQDKAVTRFKASPLMESLRTQQMLLSKPDKRVAGLASVQTQ